MIRWTRWLVLVGAVWLLAGMPTSAPAQSDASNIGGFNISAHGSAVTFVYNQPSSPIPAHPTGEIHAAYSLATLGSGPTGRGVAAVMWPGETAATVGPFIEDSVWSGIKSGFEQGGGSAPFQENPQLVPKEYPAGAVVALPPGGDQTAPFAHSQAQDHTVDSHTDPVNVSLPGILQARVATSSASSALDQVKDAEGGLSSGAIAHATSVVQGVSILDGMVTIDEVSTHATATSDGEHADLAGHTVVSGLQIAGHGYTIDEQGIHAEGQDQPDPITGQLNQNAASLLKDSGVKIVLAQPVDDQPQDGVGARASRDAGGLIVEIGADRMQQIEDSLPTNLRRQLQGNGVQFDQTFTVVLATVNVTSGASPAFTFDFGGQDFASSFSQAPPAPQPSVSGNQVSSPGPTPAVFNSTPAPVVSPAPPQQQVTTQPAFAGPVDVNGVSSGLIILALVGVAVAARFMHGMSEAALAGRGAGEVCDDQ